MWYPTLGVFDRNNLDFSGEQHQLLTPDTITCQTGYGELYRLAPAAQFSETPGRWEDPILAVRGANKPEWRDGSVGPRVKLRAVRWAA